MNRDDLARFLASVRKKRFIDYLDPIGETAPKAFDRRLRWAERSQDDPAHAEEARFILANAVKLRDVIRDEMDAEASDWVQGVEAGSEAGKAGWKGGAKTATDASMIGTPKPANRAGESVEIDEQLGIMRLEDVTPTPPANRTGLPVKGSPKSQGEARSARNANVGPGRRVGTESLDADAPTPVPPGRLRAPGHNPTLPTTSTPAPAERRPEPMPPLTVVPQIGTPAPQAARTAAPPPKPTPPAPTATIVPPVESSPAKTSFALYIGGGLVLGLLLLVGSLLVWKGTHPPVAANDLPPPIPEKVVEVPREVPPEVPPEAPPEKAVDVVPPEVEPPVVIPPEKARVPEKPKPPEKAKVPGKAPEKPIEEPTAPEVPQSKVIELPPKEPEKLPEAPPEKPPEPAVVVSAGGRYAGKAGGMFLALTISGSGTAITATAQVQAEDGPQDFSFRGSFDPETGTVTLTDPATGARLVGVLKDGRISGTGSLGTGKPDITWSAAR